MSSRTLLIIALPAALCRCNAVLGIEDLPRARRFEEASRQCGVCVDVRCRHELEDCAVEELCAAAYDCHARCGPTDWACRAACRAGSSSSDDPTFVTLDGCRREACTTECFADGEGLEFHGKACGACLAQTCESELAECVGDPWCEEAVACVTSDEPYDPDRSLQCFHDHPAAQAEMAGLHSCTSGATQCNECPVGHDFGCLGSYAWERTAANVVGYHVNLLRWGGLPLEEDGFRVEACPRGSCGTGPGGKCNSPDSFTHSIWGGADIDLGVHEDTGAFDGCLQIDYEGSAWVPTIYYFGRPIARSEGTLGIQLIERERLDDLLKAAGRTRVPTRAAHVLATAFDCVLSPARGVTFDPLGTALPIYFQSSAPAGGAMATQADGSALFVAVSSAEQTLVVSNEMGTVGATAIRAVPGWLTQAAVYPSPDM